MFRDVNLSKSNLTSKILNNYFFILVSQMDTITLESQENIRKLQVPFYFYPIILIGLEAIIFYLGAIWFGPDWGYLIGFLFYDVIFCVTVPWILIGNKKFASIFQQENRLFQKKNWYVIILIFVIPVIAIIMYWDTIITYFDNPWLLIVIAIPVTIIQSSCEEILWRGVYSQIFRTNIFWGFIFPTLSFAVWHFCPQIIYPSGNYWQLVVSSLFLGLPFGLIAYKTKSANWTILLHSIIGIIALGAPLGEVVFRIFT